MDVPSMHPQEVEVWYILPAIRRELVLEMQKLDNSQKKIAQLLNLTEAAVSQYLSSKRGKQVHLSKDIKQEIHQAAARITTKERAYFEIQRVSELIKRSKDLCKIHQSVEKGLSGCDICFQKG